jgi:hypothetical protein
MKRETLDVKAMRQSAEEVTGFLRGKWMVGA